MRKRKHAEYFARSVEAGYSRGVEFSEGDRVRILNNIDGRNGGHVEGTITSFVHGNFGKGRIYATIKTDSGTTRREPLGRLRKIREGE